MFAKVEPQTQGGASRTGVRVFTGTVPDYASDAKGLLLGGVVAGGPAEAAGLQKGDVIVEIAGQTIANIYDYTYALDVLKIGQPAKVVYMRGRRTERNDAHAVGAKVVQGFSPASVRPLLTSQSEKRDHVGLLRRLRAELTQQRRHLAAVIAAVVDDVDEHLPER